MAAAYGTLVCIYIFSSRFVLHSITCTTVYYYTENKSPYRGYLNMKKSSFSNNELNTNYFFPKVSAFFCYT